MIRMSSNHKNNRSSKAVLVWCLIAMLGIYLGGCRKEQPASTPAANGQASPKTPNMPVGSPQQPTAALQKPVSSARVQIASPQKNQLDFSSRKDPFKAFVNVKAVPDRSKPSDEKKNGLPIHNFDVSQFRLIGTVMDAKGNKAMVVDPSGKGYVLKVGMTIGQNEGKVVKIDVGGVDVVEQSRDAFNKIRKETVRIPLLKKP